MTEQTQVKTTQAKYPSAFLFGGVAGMTLNLASRFGTFEPLSARPFSYLKLGLMFSAGFGYYDYWRRCAMQEVMVREQESRYYRDIKSLNNAVRYGEEDEISNLTDYLAGHTLRQ